MLFRKARQKGAGDGRYGELSTNRSGFTIARRGYDTAQVDAYLTALHADPASADPHPAFTVCRRGYDCAEVDAYLEQHIP